MRQITQVDETRERGRMEVKEGRKIKEEGREREKGGNARALKGRGGGRSP